ncbi:hypothetical protein RUND412_010443 [Rhizina undulata]
MWTSWKIRRDRRKRQRSVQNPPIIASESQTNLHELRDLSKKKSPREFEATLARPMPVGPPQDPSANKPIPRIHRIQGWFAKGPIDPQDPTVPAEVKTYLNSNLPRLDYGPSSSQKRFSREQRDSTNDLEIRDSVTSSTYQPWKEGIPSAIWKRMTFPPLIEPESAFLESDSLRSPLEEHGVKSRDSTSRGNKSQWPPTSRGSAIYNDGHGDTPSEDSSASATSTSNLSAIKASKRTLKKRNITEGKQRLSKQAKGKDPYTYPPKPRGFFGTNSRRMERISDASSGSSEIKNDPGSKMSTKHLEGGEMSVQEFARRFREELAESD